MNDTLKPKEIVDKLNKYIVGQSDAKRAVAIALRNRWRRNNAAENIKDEIMPNNIIMMGPTGVGKTEIARRLADISQAPFIKVEATKFTEVGYVGRDVESIIRDLMDISVKLVEDEVTELIKDESNKNTEDLIIDLLLPEYIEEGFAGKEKKSFLKTKELLKEKLHNGELDNESITIEVPDSVSGFKKIVPFDKNGMNDLAEELGMALGISGKKIKKDVTIKEAREIIFQQEIDENIDKNKIIEEARIRAETDGIVFIDEIDKIAIQSDSRGPDVSRQGVQRDLLPIVEGSTVKTKYGFIKTDHILFIASGAFHESKPSDLIPELQGRFPIRVELDSLTTEDFVMILTNTSNAPIKQYQALMDTEGISLNFEDSAIKTIAEKATEINDKNQNIGARRLHTIMTKVLEKIMFDAPDTDKKIAITSKNVVEALDHIINEEDLSNYIL